MSIVAGQIVIPDGALTVSAAQVVVRVRDTTYSDAPTVEPVAQPVARVTLTWEER